jgi:hypothetical protein
MVKKQQVRRSPAPSLPSRRPNRTRLQNPQPRPSLFPQHPSNCDVTEASVTLQSLALLSPSDLLTALRVNGIEEVAIGRGTIYTLEEGRLRTERRGWMAACVMQSNREDLGGSQGNGGKPAKSV